ncbi:MAG: VOC family protein, partial [Balneolaceae bacterium]
MKVTQIKETCLYIQDLDRTEDFYHGKLNFQVIAKAQERHIFFKAGASVLLCFISDTTRKEKNLPAHYGEGKMHLAFEVPEENYESVKKWIQSKGIEIEHEQKWKKGVRSFYFRDPD